LLDCPAQDIPEDILRVEIHNLRDMLHHPDPVERDDENILQEYSERLQELRDEFQRRKDEGIIPEHDTISESDSDTTHVDGDLNSSNTQNGGSAVNGVDTSTSSATTNNQSSTGSDSFSFSSVLSRQLLWRWFRRAQSGWDWLRCPRSRPRS